MKVVLVQMAVADGEDAALRFQRAETLLKEIEHSADTPDLILFPELWGCGFQNYSGYAESAEELQGNTWQFACSWAKRLNCWIHGGSFVEVQRDGGVFYNTSLLFDRNGKNRGIYRKMHLFGFESLEPEILTAGDSVTEVESEFGCCGMTTCYDLRFPEQFRYQENSEKVPGVFLVTAAWPHARLEHWRLFNQVRAVENQCYIISCNAAGLQCGVRGAGHSMITDPWGTILVEGSGEESVIWCDLDLEKVEECRRHFPALHDRKTIKREKEG